MYRRSFLKISFLTVRYLRHQFCTPVDPLLILHLYLVFPPYTTDKTLTEDYILLVLIICTSRQPYSRRKIVDLL